MNPVKSIRIGLLFVGLAAGAPLFASSTSGFGTISNVSATSGGALLFRIQSVVTDAQTKVRRVTQSRDSASPCPSAQSDRWAIDAGSGPGEIAATTLLWAFQNERQVSVKGTGKCSAVENVELVSEIVIQDVD